MEVPNGLQTYLVLTVLLVFGPLFIAYVSVHSAKAERRQKDEREQRLKEVLAQHGIVEFQILKDRTRAGGPSIRGPKRPFEVFLILYCAPNRWFLYTHIEDTPPVLLPLSELRAQRAANY